MKNPKPILTGLMGVLGLNALYFLLLILANSTQHAGEQFAAQWYWLILLSLGFGVQLGLYSFIRIQTRMKMKKTTPGLVASGGISTGSMVACCAHHLVDVLPIVGLSAAAVFLARYQVPFVLIGVFANLVGISIMLGIIQDARLYGSRGIPNSLLGAIDMKGLRNLLIVIGLVVISGAFALVVIDTTGRNRSVLAKSSPAKANVESSTPGEADEGSSLPAKTNEENLLEVIVKPLELKPGRPATFEIGLNTHMGSLDYDLTSPSVSTLEDDQGNRYFPTSWGGSTGGHHLSGVLTFPELRGNAKMIRLTLKGLYDVPERVFEWTIPNQ